MCFQAFSCESFSLRAAFLKLVLKASKSQRQHDLRDLRVMLKSIETIKVF